MHSLPCCLSAFVLQQQHCAAEQSPQDPRKMPVSTLWLFREKNPMTSAAELCHSVCDPRTSSRGHLRGASQESRISGPLQTCQMQICSLLRPQVICMTFRQKTHGSATELCWLRGWRKESLAASRTLGGLRLRDKGRRGRVQTSKECLSSEHTLAATHSCPMPLGFLHAYGRKWEAICTLTYKSAFVLLQ